MKGVPEHRFIAEENLFVSHRPSRRIPFPASPVAAVCAAMCLLASGAARAAEPTVAELQAEIARLKDALQAAQNKNKPAEDSKPAAAPDTAPAAPTAEAPAEAPALGGVTVRSRNRIEKLQDVPLSVSVVTGKELDRLAATDISEITKRAANVAWNKGNQRTSSLSIRGIGKIGQTEAQDPSVGTIVDGVNYAYNALTSSFDFTDVEAVEVTRGPQGTLLGKNTSLGVVNIVTRKPSFTPTADYSLGFGQNNTVTGTLAAGGPVVDDLLAWRGVLSVSRGEGDIVNLYNRDITYTNRDRVSGRVQFLLRPSADFDARVALDLQPRAGETTNGRTINTPTPATYANGSTNTLSTDPAVRLTRRWFTQQGSYTYARDFLYGGSQNAVNNDNQRALVTGSRGATAELNWRVADHTITSISAYKDYHFDASNDEGTPFDVYRNAGGFWNDYKQWSQELRLSSRSGGFVDYQTGLYFIKVRNSAEYRREWGSDAGAWFATPAQYKTLDADAAGRQLLLNSLDGLKMAYNSPAGIQDIRNDSAAVFGQANWHVSEPLTVTTGIRFTREDRRNTAASDVKDSGFAPELNPAIVNSVNLGGFVSNAAGDLDAANNPAQLALADALALKYFGQAAGAAAGDAYRSLTAAQKAQVAAAKALRAAQIGVVFAQAEAQPFKKTQPSVVLSPSYKINPELTSYFSLQYGEKAGIAQFVNGNSSPVRPEKTTSYELGLKSLLLNKTLVLNADVFLMNIKDYQQSVRVVDDYTTALNRQSDPAAPTVYATATGNVPKVKVSGLEVDGVYQGIRNTTLRFSGAYNRAIYKEFPNSAQPVENGYTGAPAYQDVSGRPVAGAPRYTFNIGADYRLPVLADKEFHTSANLAFTSGYYSDVALSSYSVIPKNTQVDVAVGLGNRNKNFDVSLIVKNLFNDDTPQLRTWNTITPAVPRWVGVVFTGKL